ncbi:GntR family transcriptional regulator [Pseudomonas huanghezhanensis]|uniref:GntR family transcriptional regulator n=1 Tax=Pseudomonas huanghezhanensis TaxID=3002903 RepID=UPI002285AEF8|nr:GntR family transcriptional regulator [Pseudomonas sp. BSw22131]
MTDAPNLGVAPSASEVISKHLRDAIISGQFAEDEPIRQDDIARVFNVSKIPVREALKRLEAEGLVRFMRNKGAVVTRISEPELAQIFEVRVLLESQAIRLAVPKMTTAHIARASAICDEFMLDDNVGRWAELNWAFHTCLYEASERPFLLNMIRSIHDKVERYLRVQMTFDEGKERADQEHRGILQACADQDVEKAVELIEHHIIGVCRTLYAHLPNATISEV